MRTALLALFGLFSFTVVCPVAMGAMPTNMGDMPAISHIMQDQNEHAGAMKCEQCEKDKDEIAASADSQTEVTSPAGIQTTLLAFWELSEPHRAELRIPMLANAPPIPTETLIGTVVLLT
ncbi:MAG: hypothetical protein ABIG34_02710 [Candidatus Peregrinibacteria bacterium]